MTHYIGIATDLLACSRAVLCKTDKDPLTLSYSEIEAITKVRLTRVGTQLSSTSIIPSVCDTIIYFGNLNKVIGYTKLQEEIDIKALKIESLVIELDFTIVNNEIDVTVVQSYRQHNADTASGIAHEVKKSDSFTRSELESLPCNQKSYATNARTLMDIPENESKIIHYSGKLMWSTNTQSARGVKGLNNSLVTLEYIGIGYTIQISLEDNGYICPGYQNNISGSYYNCKFRRGSTVTSGIVFLGWEETGLMIKPIHCYKWDNPTDPHGTVELSLLKCGDGNLALSGHVWYGTDGTDIYKGVVTSGACIPQESDPATSINAYNLPTVINQETRILRVAHDIKGEARFYSLDKNSGALMFCDNRVQYAISKFKPEHTDLLTHPIKFADESLLIQYEGNSNYSVYNDFGQKLSLNNIQWIRPISSGLILFKNKVGAVRIWDLIERKVVNVSSATNGFVDPWRLTKCSSNDISSSVRLIDGWLGSFTQLESNNKVRLI